MPDPLKLLFVCSRNRLRSPTAEAIFASDLRLEVTSAGTSPDAETVVSAELIAWADVIFAMETKYRKKLNEHFSASLRNKKLVVLGIRDRYSFMQRELVDLLETKVRPHLKI